MLKDQSVPPKSLQFWEHQSKPLQFREHQPKSLQFREHQSKSLQFREHQSKSLQFWEHQPKSLQPWEHQPSSSSMPTNSIAELASQLQAFISTKHPFASDLDPAILQSIEFYAPPPTSSPVPAPTSQERSSRSVARLPESPPYPVEWADSRSQLRSAVRHFQELLKRRTASELTGDAPEAFQSQANHPINSTITKDLTPLISTAQAPETHQTVSQDTTTMASLFWFVYRPRELPNLALECQIRWEIRQMIVGPPWWPWAF